MLYLEALLAVAIVFFLAAAMGLRYATRLERKRAAAPRTICRVPIESRQFKRKL